MGLPARAEPERRRQPRADQRRRAARVFGRGRQSADAGRRRGDGRRRHDRAVELVGRSLCERHERRDRQDYGERQPGRVGRGRR